jgi:hypothetical protein
VISKFSFEIVCHVPLAASNSQTNVSSAGVAVGCWCYRLGLWRNRPRHKLACLDEPGKAVIPAIKAVDVSCVLVGVVTGDSGDKKELIGIATPGQKRPRCVSEGYRERECGAHRCGRINQRQYGICVGIGNGDSLLIG